MDNKKSVPRPTLLTLLPLLVFSDLINLIEKVFNKKNK